MWVVLLERLNGITVDVIKDGTCYRERDEGTLTKEKRQMAGKGREGLR